MEVEGGGRPGVWTADMQSISSPDKAISTHWQIKQFKKRDFASFTHARTCILQCHCKRNFLMNWNMWLMHLWSCSPLTLMDLLPFVPSRIWPEAYATLPCWVCRGADLCGQVLWNSILWFHWQNESPLSFFSDLEGAQMSVYKELARSSSLMFLTVITVNWVVAHTSVKVCQSLLPVSGVQKPEDLSVACCIHHFKSVEHSWSFC